MLTLVTVALLLTAAEAPADKGAVDKVVVEGRVVVTVPEGYTVEEVPLGEDRSLVTLRGKEGALVVTVYGGTRPPNRWSALTVHSDELKARLQAETPNEVKQRFLGHAVTARDLRYAIAGAPWRARVVAAQKDRRTVVAVATWRDESAARDVLLRAIETITVRR
ncbi:MAG: hypothetical protein EP329_22410 [Deltaproteobacteria bacterium]|nr:MAG: hypothetical protein EP329_22410 [Deltaproteobacteria bacterium]